MQLFFKILFTTILLTSFSPLRSQIAIINTTFNVKDTNVIFAEVNNYIKVYFKGSKYKFITRHSKSERMNDSIFMVSTTHLGKDSFDLVSNGRIVFRKIFQAKELAMGRFFVGAITSGIARKEDIIANGGLVFRNLECQCTIPYKILSYEIKIRSNSVQEFEKTISVEGATFNETAVNIIRKLHSGDTMEVFDIKALINFGCPRSYEPITIKIQ